MDRRTLLRQLTVAGAATAASSVVSSSPAFAATASCCRANASYTLIPQCREQTVNTSTCRTVFTNSLTVCRTLATTPMFLSRTSGGNQRPYFDELAVVSVTNQVSNVTRTQNLVGWQNNCRLLSPTFGDAAGFGSGNGSPCGTTANPRFDISYLFGNECGLFTVQIEIRNFASPFGYSACYVQVG